MPSEQQTSRDIYSISRLVRETRTILEGSFPLVWVEGEISNLARPASGHIYFSLKDEAAQVRCAMFRSKRQRLRFQPTNGQQVLIRARVSLYEARGEFQLIAEHMEPAGEGALRLAFERLKEKLAAEGLFDAGRKKNLPLLPQQIGLITSPSGAAVRDLLSVLKRRFPAIPAVIYPVPVQGAEAPAKIIRMLQLANRRQECDLLILSRGGGSLEDLLAFNDEAVARAIDASEIPLIAGIGHEIDFTIADFVADLRAPTPSAAAEHAVPDQDEWLKRIAQLFSRLCIRSKQRIKTGQLQLEKLDQRLHRQHPRQRLTQRTLRLDELTQRLLQTQTHQLLKLDNRLQNLQFRLNQQSPILWLERLRTSIDKLDERLHRSLNDKLSKRHNQLGQLARDLDNLSPLNTLKRGYAIVSKPADGQILRSSVEIQAGELAEVRLAEGHLLCEVKETHED